MENSRVGRKGVELQRYNFHEHRKALVDAKLSKIYSNRKIPYHQQNF